MTFFEELERLLITYCRCGTDSRRMETILKLREERQSLVYRANSLASEWKMIAERVKGLEKALKSLGASNNYKSRLECESTMNNAHSDLLN